MGVSQLILPLLAFVAFCNGAAIQSEDMASLNSLVDMFISNIENLDSWASSMGMTRNKREISHEGFTSYNYKGIKIGYKFNDPVNKFQGGEALIHIDNLKALIPKAHSSEVELHIHFNGGANPADGIFDLELHYALTHSDGDGVEKGDLTLKRSKKPDGKFAIALKTKAAPFSGKPIIPAVISHVDLELASDHASTLYVKYINPIRNKNTDLTFNLIQTGQLPSLQVQGTRAGRKVDLTLSVANLDVQNQKMELKVAGSRNGYLSISKEKIDLSIGNVAIIQLGYNPRKHTITINTQSPKIKAAVKKLNVMNHITFPFTLKVTELKFKKSAEKGYKIVEPKNNVEISLKYDPIHPGNVGLKASRGGKLVWRFANKVSESAMDASKVVFKSESNMKFADTSSKLYQIIDTYYPFGGFLERKATVDFSVDYTQKNYFYPKFNLHINVFKDQVNVLDLEANTVNRPYVFSLVAPNLRKYIPERAVEGIKLTIDHDIGKSLNIKYNGLGGLEFDATRAANANGGIDIHVAALKGGVNMIKYNIHTSLVNNAAKLDFGLTGDVELNPNSLLYKYIVSNYQILTPFTKRTSEVHVFVDKVHKNVVLNKFKVSAKVNKDGEEVLDLLVDFTKGPYELKLFAPEIRNRFGLSKITNGNHGLIISIDHQKGDHLEIVANLKRWSGMKIITKGNKKEVVWNGKPLGEGEFEIGPNFIILGGKKSGDGMILKDGDNIKIKLSLEGKNPKKNQLTVDVKGNKRNLDLTLAWDLSHLDFDISTPSTASVSLHAVGNNPLLGKYTINREGSLSSKGLAVHVTWTGDASFGKSKIAGVSPIKTNFDFTFDAVNKDLVGTFTKNFGGKVYSIIFPKGTGAMNLPQVTIG